MSEQAEQLVLDYLRRAGDAAYVSLRADERLDFLRRLRGRIDEMRATAGATDPAQVRKVLHRFGDPDALVARERERLRQEHEKAGDSPAEPEDGPVTEPIPVVRTDQGAQEAKTPAQTTQTAETIQTAERGRGAPAAPSTPQARPGHSGPPLYEPRSPRQAGQEVPSALSRSFDHLPPEVRGVLRGGALEVGGLILIGLGGALSPLPLWFIGALLVGLAPAWTAQDKWIGLLAPVVLVVAGSGVFAGINFGGSEQAYLQALQSYGWTLFRIGAVIGTAYLATRMLARMRRQRSGRPPWIRTNRKQP